MTLNRVRIVRLAVALLTPGLLACPNAPARQPDGSTGDDAASEGNKARVEAEKSEINGQSKRRSERTPFKASGKAVFAEMEHDFGNVEEGTEIEHVFKVRNTSEEEVLHINRVRGS